MAPAGALRALRWLGWALLWLTAALAVAISSAVLVASLPATRPFAAAAVIRAVNEAIEGRLELDGIVVLPHGGVELRGLRVSDPEGTVVLRVERASVFVDALALLRREIGCSAELEGVEVDAARRNESAELAIARAFAPRRARARPRREGGEPGEQAPGGGPGWTLRVDRLSISRARVAAVLAGTGRVEAGDLGVDARGRWGPRESWIELRASGALTAPLAAPLSLELRAVRDGARVELRRLAAGIGDDRLEAIGLGDLEARSGRLAVTRLGVSAPETAALAPAVRLGGALSGTLYAESDGGIATAALDVIPEGGAPGARARVAGAARIATGSAAWGLDAQLDRVDPSRISALAPRGLVTLRARGAARGTRLSELAGRLELRLERSRLRGGELGPVVLQATAGGGNVDVSRLEATAPGASVEGRLHWREGREVSGQLHLTAADLRLLGADLAGILARHLPRLEGSGHAEVTLSGTSRAPQLAARVEAQRLGVGRLLADGARLIVELQGPADAFTARVQGGLRRADVDGLELKEVDLDAVIRDAEGSLSFTANVPRLGSELVRVLLRGRFGERRAWFDLADAAIAWPGTRFELAGPARIGLVLPSVDRLVLAAGPQRIELSGGVARDGRLDAQLRIANVDLARLPRGLAPAEAALAGLLTVDAKASGTSAAPRVDATLGLTDGAAYDVGGLQLLGDASWDGAQQRVTADLGLVRSRGGAIDLSLDLPLALGHARPNEEVRVELSGRAVPLDELVWLAGSYALVSGDVDVAATVSGTIGDPALAARVAARNGTWDDLEGLAAEVTIDAKGERARARATGSLAGAGSTTLEVDVALDLARLLERWREAIAAARRGPLRLALRLPPAGLAPLAGRLQLPPDLAGRLSAEVELAGSPGAPRGTAWVALEGGAGWGARAVSARADVAMAPERTGATLAVGFAGKPAARLDLRFEAPAERLIDREGLAQAPVRLDATFPRSELAGWGGENLALGGQVEGRASLGGSLGAPQGSLSITASDAVVEGRPLGGVRLEARYAARRATASAELHPATGGTLRAEGSLDQPFGLSRDAGPIRDAPARLSVRAEQLDLGFLPAVAPGLVRAASGAAALDLSAEGKLGALRPVGTFRVAKGRLALAELGDWTDATIEADLSDDAVLLRRFDVRKGKGRLSLDGSLRGLAAAGKPAELEAKLVSRDFGVERAGMELARFDLSAEARGELTRDGLTIGVAVPQAEVKLPKRVPRTLQELETRKDITVGRPRPARRPTRTAPVAGGPAEEDRGPFRTVVHVVAPRRFRVRADQPRIDVELKADVLLAFAGARQEATGWIEAIRGQAEPIAGRVFELERGKVTFGGGRIAAGVLDVSARYENPSARVHALIEGTIGKPQLRLTSEPPLEEAQIAMLIATGRTDVKAGSEGVNSLAGGDAGLAAAGAVVTGIFKDLLSDKLPVDSVSVDSTALTAGKYLTDRIYVGYVRRFDAKPEKGENPDEVRIEYRLAPGWQVETRYGSGQSGGASIVWTKNY